MNRVSLKRLQRQEQDRNTFLDYKLHCLNSRRKRSNFYFSVLFVLALPAEALWRQLPWKLKVYFPVRPGTGGVRVFCTGRSTHLIQFLQER